MLQYPLTAPDNSPFLLFTPIKATFASGSGANVMQQIDQAAQLSGDTSGRILQTEVKSKVSGTAGERTVTLRRQLAYAISDEPIAAIDDSTKPSIALHIPRGVAFNDSMNYTNIQSGIIMGVLQTIKGAMKEEGGFFEGISKAYQNADDKTVSAYMARAGTGGEFLAALRRDRIQADQQILSPREFAMFDAPSLRTFSLAFKFIPESSDESEACSKIIRTFREAMYPTFQEGSYNTIYKFPKAFRIAYRGIAEKHMIKFPEVVLKDVNVTYNTNSMSYYNVGGQNSPVEIDLQLTFAELVAQSSLDIKDGY